MAQIVVAETDADLEEVRRLMRAFIDWHKLRHEKDIDLVNQYFDPTAFEAELAGLPGKYGPPGGRLLLGKEDGQPAGCVALRKVDESTCEMKRLFVYERFHGHGIGRALAERIIEDAKYLGYRRMVLDTGARQIEAQTLYHQLGFKDISPYYEMPAAVSSWLRFMALDL